MGSVLVATGRENSKVVLLATNRRIMNIMLKEYGWDEDGVDIEKMVVHGILVDDKGCAGET